MPAQNKSSKAEQTVVEVVAQTPPANSASNTKSKILPFLPRQGFTFYFLIILLTASVILLVTIFIMDSDHLPNIINPNKAEETLGFSEQLKVLSGKIETSGEDESFTKTQTSILAKIRSQEDSASQYKQLYSVSAGVGVRYSYKHNPNLRKFLMDLGTFAENTYPDQYQKTDFYIPCSDEECGSLSYDPEIKELVGKIEQAELGVNKQPMLNELYNAAISKTDENERKFISYMLALQMLENEAGKGNEKAKDLASDLTIYLKKQFANEYTRYQERRQQVGDLKP